MLFRSARWTGDRLRGEPFYRELDWEALYRMEVPPPYTPVQDEASPLDLR